MAKMPISKVSVVLRNMWEREVCYTPPWALVVDAYLNPFLDLDYPAHKDPQGTSTMKVWREGNNWYVDITDCDQKWEIGSRHECHFPVAGVFVNGRMY